MPCCSVESLVTKQQGIDALDDAIDVMRALQALANGVAPLTHLLEIAVDVDTRPVLEIDDQGGLHQIEQRLRARGDLPEALPREGRVSENASVRHTHQSSC